VGNIFPTRPDRPWAHTDSYIVDPFQGV